MTAVAPPLSFQPPSRTGWNSSSLNGLSHDELSRALNMQNPQPRKTAQRSNSSASLSSASSSSTISAPLGQANGAAAEAGGYTTRKKGTRPMFVPIGKSEPTAGLSTARPQPVSSGSSGPSAASTISALHAPMLPSQQMANGQQNGTIRNGPPAQEPTAILHLLPMNGTFERKTISVPFYPDVLRIGRQTNQKTAPTPSNGFFDSKVLSRQHAEIYAERNSGRVYIRDVKSSNGTFVNGARLSPENKESEPHPLQEQDVLELGIDIISEDQKTVVHHKVAARVEHAGIYAPGAEMSFSEMDQSANGFGPNAQMKRSGSQSSTASAKANAMAAVMQARDMNGISHVQQQRTMYTPITTETIVKRLNRELNLAKQQSQDLARSRQCLEALLSGEPKKSDREGKSEKGFRPSPSKSKTDLKNHFSEPPAPPPQQPLPEKPDVAKALADPVIQPLLLRAETSRPLSHHGSPTRPDHSQTLLILTQELKLAKDQIPSLEDRVKNLEDELKAERTARETAEERAQRLEDGSQSASTESSPSEPIPIPGSRNTDQHVPAPETDDDEVRAQIDRLKAQMDEMKKQMEAYHRRAEIAESERDDARQTLAEMIEQKRKDNANAERRRSRSRSSRANPDDDGEKTISLSNGHSIMPISESSDSVTALLEKAGVKPDEPLTPETAINLRHLLTQHYMLHLKGAHTDTQDAVVTVNGISDLNANNQGVTGGHKWFWGSAVSVFVVGVIVMISLDRVESVHRLGFLLSARIAIVFLPLARL